MKILCKTEEEYRPAPFDHRSANELADDVHDAIYQKYGKRFKKISVDIDDIKFDDDYVKFYVDVYNDDKLKFEGEFEFSPYSDYWDQTDYEQHKKSTIARFVKDLAA